MWEDFLKAVAAQYDNDYLREEAIRSAKEKVIYDIYSANVKANEIKIELTDEEKAEIEERVKNYIKSDAYIANLCRLDDWDKRILLKDILDNEEIGKWGLIWKIIRNKE